MSNVQVVDLPEPDYDLTFLEDNDDDDYGVNNKKVLTKKGFDMATEQLSQYILGTLIVRVVAAKDLQPAENGNGGVGGLGSMLFGGMNNNDTTNPYASVRFGNSIQRTTELFDTLDPIWPRSETMFMDVALPLSATTHLSPDDDNNDDDPYNNNNNVENLYGLDSSNYDNDEYDSNEQYDDATALNIPKPILTVAVFHTPEIGKANKKYNPSKQQQGYGDNGGGGGDSDDCFLGMAAIDVTQLLTGKATIFDQWVPLSGTSSSTENNNNNANSQQQHCSMIRICCEYEPSDPPPNAGDLVRFTRFCHPVDLFPLIPGMEYTVQEVDGDDVVLCYTSPEGWVCSFVAHRFMVLCVDRHRGAIEFCQDEWMSLVDRLAHSPLLHAVAETVDRVPDDGLIHVGAQVVQESASLINRWLQGGVGTAVNDVVFATNFDGTFCPPDDPNILNVDDYDLDDGVFGNNAIITDDNDQQVLLQEESLLKNQANHKKATRSSSVPLPNMPVCPITGEPMIDPVVAADGHTYERSAIARWLMESDKSPLTGSILHHKELVPNYSLLSSIQEQQQQQQKEEESSKSNNNNNQNVTSTTSMTTVKTTSTTEA